MKKMENIDLISTMQSIVDIHTKAYKEDFEYDKQTLFDAANNSDLENRFLLWMCRDAGTWCFRENAVYTKDSPAHNVWTYYENDDKILAYAIKITSSDDLQIRGNLYPLEYQTHCQSIIKDSLPAEKIIQPEIYMPNELLPNILSDVRKHREKAATIDVPSYLKQIENKAKRFVSKKSR